MKFTLFFLSLLDGEFTTVAVKVGKALSTEMN